MKPEHKNQLLQIASDAISQCLELPGEKQPFAGALPAELMETRAAFVTLTLGGKLRGCIGTLEAFRPLAEDVAENACAAAFEDPRFEPLAKQEFEKLEIHISVLSPPEELTGASEADFFRQIRPGVDGLILQEGFRRGTFLPCVWEELPQKNLFWAHLKRKAGLPADYWSDRIRVFRYTAEYFPEQDGSL
ncbi:MAG: AmmeMemoRadiSam system protein A [Pontiellaceae bacterium]|nr:AmmeMemoRadiSam system protein A [Pontiellaceae bacterium]